jgi:hypothetical protein
LDPTEDIVDKRFIQDGLDRRVSREPRSRDDFTDTLELSTSVPVCLCALPSTIVCLRASWEPLRPSRLGRPLARSEVSAPREGVETWSRGAFGRLATSWEGIGWPPSGEEECFLLPVVGRSNCGCSGRPSAYPIEEMPTTVAVAHS